MDDEKAQRYLVQYRYGMEVITDMVTHMARNRDLDAIRWLTHAFSIVVAEAAKSIKAMDLAN